MVGVPVTDIRREPAPVSAEAARARPYAVDEKQETQALFGEILLVYEERDGYYRVEAPDQPEYTHASRWQGYPGWVSKGDLLHRPVDYQTNALVVARYADVLSSKKAWAEPIMRLPLGSRIYMIYSEKGWARLTDARGNVGWIRAKDIRMDRVPLEKENEWREAVLAAARQFLGDPYYWGGRAGHRKWDRSVPSGVDCSGLVSISYRAAGIRVPRDSHEQFMASQPVKDAGDLRPGDLVFLAKRDRPDRMEHVMLFEGRESLLEAVHAEHVVRRVSFKKKLGRSRAEVGPGQAAGDHIVYLGRLIQP
jgi:hypothetical protein